MGNPIIKEWHLAKGVRGSHRSAGFVVGWYCCYRTVFFNWRRTLTMHPSHTLTGGTWTWPNLKLELTSANRRGIAFWLMGFDTWLIEQVYLKDDYIVREGEVSREMYFLKSGAVQVNKTNLVNSLLDWASAVHVQGTDIDDMLIRLGFDVCHWEQKIELQRLTHAWTWDARQSWLASNCAHTLTFITSISMSVALVWHIMDLHHTIVLPMMRSNKHYLRKSTQWW